MFTFLGAPDTFCICLFVYILFYYQDSVPSAFSSGDVLIPLADEYDPMFPNDYEKVVKRHREERQRQREQERQKEIDEREKYGQTYLVLKSFLHWVEMAKS